MVWIFLFVILVVIGLLAYLLSLPASYTITRSIVIEKPVKEVFTYVRDFSNWTAWSPWTLHEPNMAITLNRPTELGGTYAWDGQKIGAGQMRHEVILVNERIDILLTFLRPFKNTANVSWQFSEANGGTQISWHMQAKMPLPMRPFVTIFKRMIGLDFELGLALLRGQLDSTSEHPTIYFQGVVDLPAQDYVTEHFEGNFETMRLIMQSTYPRLWQTVATVDAERADNKPAIAAYHSVNLSEQTTVMDMGVAVKNLHSNEQGLALPAGRYFQTALKGGYQFLPLAWHITHGQIKMQKLKIDKTRPALEIYLVNPKQASQSNGWVTQLCVPLK